MSESKDNLYSMVKDLYSVFDVLFGAWASGRDMSLGLVALGRWLQSQLLMWEEDDISMRVRLDGLEKRLALLENPSAHDLGLLPIMNALFDAASRGDSTAHALALILQERMRQMNQKGYTPEHDDGFSDGELRYLAAKYIVPEGFGQVFMNKRESVTKGAAVALAELSRILRKVAREEC